MKKILLMLGTTAAAVAPIATVVACGSTTEAKQYEISYDKTTKKGTINFTGKLSAEGLTSAHEDLVKKAKSEGLTDSFASIVVSKKDSEEKITIDSSALEVDAPSAAFLEIVRTEVAKNPDSVFKDGFGSDSSGGGGSIEGAFTGSNNNKYETFKLDDKLLARILFNSETDGQYEITYPSLHVSPGAIPQFDEEGSENAFKETVVSEDALPVATVQITKAALVENANLFEEKYQEIVANLDNTKEYLFKVITDVEDETDKNNGVYTVNVYEAKEQTDTLKAAINLFKSEFEFDLNAIQEAGGAYLSSVPHVFEQTHDIYPIISEYGGVNPYKTEQGNALKDGLVDWTGYHLPMPSDATAAAAKKAAAVKILENIKIESEYIFDNKTMQPKLRIIVIDTVSKQIKTIYIDATSAFDALTKTPTVEEFSEQFKNQFDFLKVYKVVDKLKSSVEQTYTFETYGMIYRAMDLFKGVHTLAETNSFLYSSDFINKFYAFLVSENNFDMGKFIFTMDNFDMEWVGEPTTLGPKGYGGIHGIYMLLTKLNDFLSQETLNNNRDWVVERITNIEEFNDILDRAFKKAERVKSAKAFLTSRNIDFTGLNDDDILKLELDTQNNIAIKMLKDIDPSLINNLITDALAATDEDKLASSDRSKVFVEFVKNHLLDIMIDSSTKGDANKLITDHVYIKSYGGNLSNLVKTEFDKYLNEDDDKFMINYLYNLIVSSIAY